MEAEKQKALVMEIADQPLGIVEQILSNTIGVTLERLALRRAKASEELKAAEGAEEDFKKYVGNLNPSNPLFDRR